MKKTKKIISKVLFTMAVLVGGVVILAIFFEDNETKANEQTTESIQKIQDTTSTAQKNSISNDNETQQAITELVGEFAAYQVNISTDFDLASLEVNTTTGNIDTETMEIYKKDFDSMLEKLKELDVQTDNLVSANDLNDADNKLFIDSQIQGVIDDLLSLLAIGSATLGHAVEGTISDQDINDLNSASSLMDGLSVTIQSLQGIKDNEDNWK